VTTNYDEDDEFERDRAYRIRMNLCICEWTLVEPGRGNGRYRVPNELCHVHFPQRESNNKGG
jgi:hypothetical protein